INKITLKNLKPNQNYKYRVISKTIDSFQGYSLKFGKTLQSNTFSFRTPSNEENEISWVVLNDIHDHPQTIREMLYRFGIEGNNQQYDFVVFNGDSLSTTKNEEQIINHIIKPCDQVFARSKSFYLGRGNHETRGSLARSLKRYFFYPVDRYYTAFSRWPVRFAMLDSGE